MIVTRKHEISCGHLLSGHGGKCERLHGHNYIFHLSYEGKPDLNGMVVDFADIKNTVCRWLDEHWDHRFLVWDRDPRYNDLKAIDPSVVGVPFNPTAERLAEFVLDRFQFIDDAELLTVRVEETSKCAAEITR